MAQRVDRILESQLLPLMLAHARESGLDLAPWKARFELPPDADRVRQVRLPLTEFHRLCDELAQALGDPFLGVHLATSVPRGAYGLMEFIVHSSGSLREALQAFRRYSGVVNELIEVTFEELGREAIFRHRVPGVPLCTGTHANEFMLVYAARKLREVTGHDFTPREVWLGHARTGELEPLVRALGTERIAFDRGENGFRFDAAFLDLPVSGAEPALNAFLTAQAESAVASLGAGLPLPARVRARIEQGLEKGPVSVESVARALHMSGRTLQRQLDEQGTSFQALLDEVRRVLAMRLLESSDKKLNEVAFRLGYRDVRAFSRAFKRWTGSPPRGS